MTTLATASSLREALTPEALTRARRRLLTAHPDPTRANTPTPGSLTDEQLRVFAAHEWAPTRIAALDTNTIATAAPITRALLAESVRETLERRLATERPHGHLRRHARRTRRIQQGTRRRLRPRQPPPRASHHPRHRPGPRTPTRSRACSPTPPCSTLTGTPRGAACSTRASEAPSCSRHQATSAWPRPSMPSPPRPSTRARVTDLDPIY